MTEAGRIWTLIARKFADEASEADIKELEISLRADPVLDEMARKLMSALEYSSTTGIDISKQQKLFEKIQITTGQHENKNMISEK